MFCFDITGLRKPRKAPNIAYLLGSGLSIPFGLPGVRELTNKILGSDKFASLHTDQCYHVNCPAKIYQSGDVTTSIAVGFIKLVQCILSCEDTLNRIPDPTYEDVADFIKQYHLSLIDEYENPALSPQYLKEIDNYSTKHNVETKRLLEYTVILIDCMLKYFLDNYDDDVFSKIDLLDNVFPYFLLKDQINLFTLNHDLLVEYYLRTKNITHTDGFYPNQDDLNYFNLSKFWQSPQQIRIVKLHGSIDRYYHNQSMIKASDPDHINDTSSNGFCDSSVPSVLSGKIVKMLDYSKPIHADLYGYFRVKLATEISKLIVVGYGFGDKGINNALSSWFGLNSNNRLIVITCGEDTLISKARFAMGRILADQRLRQNRRVVILDGGIENLSSNSIVDALS